MYYRNEYLNCRQAYYSLLTYLNLKGEEYDNKTARSKENISLMREAIGVSFEVVNLSDIRDLIEEIDPDNSVTRLNWLQELAEEFISDEYIKSDKHYTYNNRIHPQKKSIFKNILSHQETPNRQAFLGIWNIEKDVDVLGEKEVPCSIGYHFIPRNGILNMVYFMRSLDINIWPNDVFLSRHVLNNMCYMTNHDPGRIIFSVGSFHLFE